MKQDFHSRAYAVLLSARSARMAETLGLADAATSARCTVCHSPLQAIPRARLTNTEAADEGVSCENCHGAAGEWLRGHTRKDWNYPMRVGAGMRDLRNFYVRANTCVACHQNLDVDLWAAGHPELTFELDGQSADEPKHWRDDPGDGPRAWLVGQAVALRELSGSLTKSKTPDRLTTLRWNALTWLLAKSTEHQTAFSPVVLAQQLNHDAFANMQDRADMLAQQAATAPWPKKLTGTILHALAASDAEFTTAPMNSPDLFFFRAKRLVLALDRLARGENNASPPAPTARALQALFADVRAQLDFKPSKFAADLVAFRATNKSLPE